MKKRVVSLLLCLIMALSLIPTAAFATEGVDADSAPADEVQVQEAATDEVAVQWDGGHGGSKMETDQKQYNGAAYVWYVEAQGEDDNVSSVTLGGQDVKYNGTARKASGSLQLKDAYGATVTPSNEGKATLKIIPKVGWYVTKVYIACVDPQEGTAYACKTYANKKAFEKNFTISNGTSVSVDVESRYFSHTSNSMATPPITYYIVISTEMCPKPVYVGYFAGKAGTNDLTSAPVDKDADTNWVKDYYTKEYEDQPATHRVLGISAAAVDEAKKLGYVFDGWQVSYYGKYYENKGTNTNVFENPLSYDSKTITPEEIAANYDLSLLTHAKLVAQWKEAPKPVTGTLTVKKEVTGDLDASNKTFFITVKGTNDNYDETLSVKNGESVTFSDLKIGNTYTITEADANVDGYEWTCTVTKGTNTLDGGKLDFTKDTTVTVTNNYTQKPTVTDYVFAPLTIKKVDSETEDVLADAKFELRKGTDTLPLTYNAEKGIYEVSITADGTWSLYETEAPFGYKDVPATGKQVATVIVTANDSAPVFDAKRDNWVITKTYEVTEVSATKVGDAYQIENDKDFGKDVTIPATITINKSDENGKPLTGAEFALSLGTTKTLTSVDNNDGTYTISGIDTVGAWTLSETKAPERHQKTDKTWTVNVTKALEVTQDPDTGVYQNVYTYSADSTEFEVTNNRWYADEVINPATLTIYKSDSKIATKMLEGAKFTLTQGTTVLESEDKGNGVYTISGINNIGKWTLTETTAPQGYVLPTEGWTINVSRSLTFNEVEIDDNGVKKYQKVYTYETDQPKDTMFIKNSAMGTLTIDKVLNGLNPTDFEDGFAFEIKDADDNVVATVNKVFPDMTQPATVTLVPGTYTIVEKSANKDGYDLTTEYDKQTFTVVAGENVTVTVTNTYEKITGTVTIDKVLNGLNPTDFEDGFAFEIKDASGKVVATVNKVFPDMTQPATVTLVPGTYTIVEKSANKDGYDLTTEYDKQTFTVEADKNVTVTVTNTYTKQVTPPPAEYTLSVDIQKNIELKRSSSRKPGKASFTFEAYLVDENGNEKILDTVTIDTKGTKSAKDTLTFTLTDNDLSITGHGTVYVREVKGDTRGWTYDDTVYALGVELLNGRLYIFAVDTKHTEEPVTLEFTNVYYKRSTTTGGDDKPIKSVKTGDMGIAMYAMTSLLSLGGAALVIKKRKEEK